MNTLFHQHVESKRQELIDRLIDANIYKIDGKQLFQLPLSKLEWEYGQVRLQKKGDHSAS